MARGGVSGQGLRGGLQGMEPDRVSQSPFGWFHRGGSSSSPGRNQSRGYYWGARYSRTADWNGSYEVASTGIDAFPQVFECPGTLKQLFTINPTVPAGTKVRYGLYSNFSRGALYPHARLWQSGLITATTKQTHAVDIAVEAQTVLWLVAWTNAAEGGSGGNANFFGLDGDQIDPPLLGHRADRLLEVSADPTKDGPAYGWRIARAWSESGLPATMPDHTAEPLRTTWPLASTNFIPAVGFTFELEA